MPAARQPKKRVRAPTAASEQFAAMSRAVVGASKLPAAAKKLRVVGGAAAKRATATADAATTKALELGRKQAAWVLERRQGQLAARAKVVKALPRAKRGGTPPSGSAATKAATTRAATATRAGTSKGVLVAEGDSWFDYPFHDVLKELDDGFGWEVESVAHYGHTVESMAYDGGQLDDFVRAIEKIVRRGQSPHAILLSGGGNDVAGEGFGMLLNHRSSPVHGLDPQVIAGIVGTRVRTAYATILAAVTSACESLVGAKVPIVLHGYDYPVADGRGVLGGWGPLPGPWLAPGFAEKGYDDLAERIRLTRELIDALYAMLGQVVALPAFAHVKVVNLRNVLSTDTTANRYRTWWGNELHPTALGFTTVAAKFDAAL
jgi:hypothetical protein